MSRTNRTVARLLLSLFSFVVPACADDQQAALEPAETEASGESADQGRPDPAHPSACGQVDEFARPEGTSAQDIVAGSDGNLWFADRGTIKSIGRITPSGTITEFPIAAAGSSPRGIAAGPDGNVWFTDVATIPAIGLICLPTAPLCSPTDVTNHSIHEYGVTANGGNAGTPSPRGITAGPDGNLWFTAAAPPAADALNKIGRITPAGTVAAWPGCASSEIEAVCARTGAASA